MNRFYLKDTTEEYNCDVEEDEIENSSEIASQIVDSLILDMYGIEESPIQYPEDEIDNSGMNESFQKTFENFVERQLNQ